MTSHRPRDAARSPRAVVALAVLVGTVVGLPGASAEEPPAPALVSTRADGSVGNGASGTFGTSVSADGSVVAFSSVATDLHPDDADAEVDVYVKRRDTGLLVLVSASSTGDKASAFSLRPSLDARGDTVAFLSAADDLDIADTDGLVDVFVKDLATGELVLASTSAEGGKADAGSSAVDLAADGTSVAFTSRATNLSPQDTDRAADVYVKDLTSGQVLLASRRADGSGAAAGDYGTGTPSLSADGTRVAFDTDARLDPADTDDAPDVYVKDLTTGDLRLASVAPGGADSARGSYRPSLSADGRSVAFDSPAADLVPEDESEDSDVYVKDLVTGALTVVSTTGRPDEPVDGRSVDASLSRDGRTVAFSSQGAGLGPRDDGTTLGAWVKDLRTGTLTLASARPTGHPANALSIAPRLSADGSTVVFTTPATDLSPADGNGWADVYARELPATASPPAPPPPAPAPADRQAPVVTLTASPQRLAATASVTVTLSGAAVDAGSGVRSVRFTVHDEYGVVQPVVERVAGEGRRSVGWTRTISLPARTRSRDVDGRQFRIRATATDMAGNTARTRVRVVATVRLDHLPGVRQDQRATPVDVARRSTRDAPPRTAGPTGSTVGIEGGGRNS